MKALAFGEVLWDVYPESKHLGGATMNFAAHVKRCGGDAWIVTAVGEDPLGRETVDEITRLGIRADYVTRSKKETGKCVVTLDENKIPSYALLDDVAYDDIRTPSAKGERFDVLYFGTLALRNANNRFVIEEILKQNAFGHRFVDVNIRPPFYSAEVVRFALENATVVKISDEELPTVMDVLGKECGTVESCAEALSEDFDGLKLVLITRGEKGAFVYDVKERAHYECGAERVEVVSTVGAGDSFSASFLVKYFETRDIPSALSFASRVSAFVVSREGAIPDYAPSDFE